jgi:hypothetical protein
MGRAKEIIVKVIPSKIANEFIKKHHYSGKVVQNSSLHFGCFLDGGLHGVLSYGSPLDKSKVLQLVKPCLWNEMLELNRMAFNEYLPKYSESRCIAISIRLIKKNAPHIKWILSFSDATKCGDGTIYRASGFSLTAIRENKDLIQLPNGFVFHEINSRDGGSIIQKKRNSDGYTNTVKWLNDKYVGWKRLIGYQLRYIYLIDKACQITVPILPFSKIDELGAGMYKGKNVSLQERKNNHAVLAQGSADNTLLSDGVRSDHTAQLGTDGIQH